MRIYNNIPALQAINSLTRATGALQKSIQKLSAGLRVNSAADDAAGLAISEKMRAQVRGLDQAAKNSQDAISLIQTAEGALGEIHSNLQRMRELSVQAANDTITQNDREYIQLEVEQLKEEIDRIATTTQFNKMRILDGMASAIWSSDKLSTEAMIRGAFADRDEFGQKVSNEGNFRIEIQAKPGTGQVLKSNILSVAYEPIPPEPPEVPEAAPPVGAPITPQPEPVTPTASISATVNFNINTLLIQSYTPGGQKTFTERMNGYTYTYSYNTATGVIDDASKRLAIDGRATDGTYSINNFRIDGTGAATNFAVSVDMSSVGKTANIILNNVNIEGDISPTNRRQITAFDARNADVNLFLEGTNTIRAGFHSVGVYVPTGRTMTITSLAGDNSTSGTLNAFGAEHGAGIGSGCSASGHTVRGGTIIINGGTVYAEGGQDGAGIGAGSELGRADPEAIATIVINGGDVTAKGGERAAGIGGGYGGGSGNITINGGTVTATGGVDGAGIGGASGGERGNVMIVGGTVTAQGGNNGAGIGGGANGASDNITISNDFGTTIVNTTGGVNGAGLGGGLNGGGGNVYIIDFETLNATGGSNGAGIGGGAGGVGGNVTITGGDNTVVAQGTDGGAGIGGGGNAGAGGNFGIYGGNVQATGGTSGGAGIGGGAGGDGGTLRFVSGTTTAQGGTDGAGIGGGRNGDGGIVELYDGTVNATGGNNGAGIGGGANGSGGDISLINMKTVNGRVEQGHITVNAQGGDNGAGMGGGNNGSGGSINLYSGVLNSTGGAGGAGVGGGTAGSGGEILLANGNLLIQGGDGGAGMGGGVNGDGGNMTVYGGNGNIYGGTGGTGMGGGRGGAAALITVPYGLHNDANPAINPDFIFTLKGRLYAIAGTGGRDNIDKADVIEELVTKTNLPLKDIAQFYGGSSGAASSGISGEPGSGSGGKGFSVYDPKILTIYQGDGHSTSVTLYGYDTMYSVAEKINDAIAFNLGQSIYVDSSYKNFCTISEGMESTSESIYTDDVPVYEEVSVIDGYDENGMEVYKKEMRVKGHNHYATMLVRSVIPGAEGELKFSGDEELLKALGLSTVRESRESEFFVSVYDAHSGDSLKSLEKITGNMLYGAIADSVDVRFDPLANTKVTWNEKMKQFDFTSEEGESYTTFVHIADRTMTFQIGANEGEDMMIGIGNMNSRSLGIHKVLVVDQESAARALTVIDGAIDRLSKQRAGLGAYQNRLEHTINNLTVASENLSASESRIRDLDMAKEMMNFTKLNILAQSAQAMLTQANQLPDGVVSLIR